MVNFRFHLVSLTAVFLALAAGIAIGAGVVDRQTVDFLEDRLQTVEDNREETNKQNDQLRGDLDEWNRFSQEAGDRMIEGTLDGVPVLLIGIEGTDGGLVDSLRNSMDAAGASLQGVLWFTDKWSLEEAGDVERLAQITDASTNTDPDDLRPFAIGRLVASWSAGALADVVIPLRNAGFLEYDAPPGREAALDQITVGTSEVVVIASADAAVPNVDLALPVISSLLDANIETLAVQPSSEPASEGEDPPPPGIATVVRAEDTVSGRVSSVDNADDFRGRMAAALALAELRLGRSGHYGVADGAQRLLPEAAR